MQPNTKIGSLVATAAATNVIIGFQPDYVEVVNVTDGQKLAAYNGQTGMTVGADGAVTVEAGIVPYEGDDGEGFTIPAGGPVNVNGETLVYNAVRSGAGGG